MEMEVGGKVYHPSQVKEKAESAAGWFVTIIVFSIINSVLIASGTDISFVIGLAVTMIADGFIAASFTEMELAGQVLGVGVGVIFYLIGIIPFVIIWQKAKKGSTRAYIVGMVLYLLDGLIFLLFGDMVGIAFHAVFLFFMWGGYPFLKRREEAEAMLAEPNFSVVEGTLPESERIDAETP